jgi:hypothetical protein
MNEIIVRNLTMADIDVIKQCIYKHDTMYGVPIIHDTYIQRYIKNIEVSYAVGAFIGDECMGICSQFFWKRMPVWSLTNLFLMTSDNLFYSRKMITVTGALMEQCIKNAESHERYEFYYVIRDTEHLTRKGLTRDIISKSNSYISERYDFINVNTIKSTADVKWEYIIDLIGDIGMSAISPPHNKTLAIRRVTIKPEFR